MAQFDIGLFDAQSNQAPTDVDEAVHRVIDIVAQSAQPLADAVVPSVIQKVLGTNSCAPDVPKLTYLCPCEE